MALSILDDKSKEPDDSALAPGLGKAFRRWNELITYLVLEHGLKGDWNFSGAKNGWSLRMLRGKRRIVYMIPCDGFFLAAFVLGEKAVRAALGAVLPGPIKKKIEEAKVYAEGRGVRFEVRSTRDLESMKKLSVIKMEN